ncbi:MAG: GNAT family N-acetyltransferase [Acidobacteriia bacterium]|nr:GNAT family N-acetyltransferase [Terriglobia bacterium]
MLPSHPNVEIAVVYGGDPALVEALNRLLPQLSDTALMLSAQKVGEILAAPGNTLFVARDTEGQIVGTLTLVVFPIPTGTRAWIEDVIVDERVRGRGVGEQLVRAAIKRAGESGARAIDLTSRPAKVVANRLYRRLGFVRRETNVYRYAVFG